MPTAQRFAVNLQCGPNTNPRDDMALHFNPRMHERVVARNSLIMGQWGQEERHGHFPFIPGQGFELLILVDHHQYKIAINGQHFCEFHCRTPIERVSYLSADGDIMISMIMFEGGHGAPGHMHAPMPGVPMAPMPGYGGHAPAAPYPMAPGMPQAPYPTHPVGGVPYPTQPGMHNPGYPAAGAYPPGNYSHLSPKSAKKAAKKQAKAQKKALKYGIPIAGAGLGAYAIHKGMKHHKHGHGYHGHSSSSSSSSSEEE